MNEKTIHILILEDDEDDAFYILDLIYGGISNPKPVVDHISDHTKIREKLRQKSYDICFLDYRLGEIDGIGLLRGLRADNISIPIILLTGQGDQEVAVEAMKAGATDYISKNKLSSEQLVNSIRYAIGLHKEAQRRKDTEEMLKRSHEELKTAHQNLHKSMDQLKTAQFQLLRSEKLAGIGRLAAGVCHEILNPLNIISGHVQALNMERNEDNILLEDLDSITEEIHRIEKIISGLLKFSRKGEMELSFIDIHSELDSVLSILEKDMVLEGIGVVRLFHPETPKLWADADRLRQVFLNLINNARFSMTKKGGKLTVFTELVPPAITRRIPMLRPLKQKTFFALDLLIAAPESKKPTCIKFLILSSPPSQRIKEQAWVYRFVTASSKSMVVILRRVVKLEREAPSL
jgi:DNA-binding response OmpR family regulator